MHPFLKHRHRFSPGTVFSIVFSFTQSSFRKCSLFFPDINTQIEKKQFSNDSALGNLSFNYAS